MDAQERKDWELFQGGARGSRERLLERYRGLACHWAGRFKVRLPWVEWDDLFQLCWIGINKALDRFDLKRGLAFSTYARHVIKRVVYESLEVKRGLSKGRFSRCRRVLWAHDLLMKEKQDSPSLEELSAATGFTVEQVDTALKDLATCSPDSLDALLSEYDDPDCSPLVRDPEWEVARHSDEVDPAEIEQLLRRLNPREQEVLLLTHWEGLSDSEIAGRLELPTRKKDSAGEDILHQRKLQALRKIRSRAYEKLRRMLAERNDDD